MSQSAAFAIGVPPVFFQAEDGIRDLVRSRGLGDVYKRQDEHVAHRLLVFAERLDEEHAIGRGRFAKLSGRDPVSYTHLTLPTSDLV